MSNTQRVPPSPTTAEPRALHAGESSRLAGQRVLVTGGEGFIGSHLTERLVSSQAMVTVVDRVPASELRNLSAVRDQIEYLQRDLVQVEFDELLRLGEFQAVFHFAGSASVPASVDCPWDDFQLNAVTTLRLLESLRRRPRPARLILASSAAVYGDTQATPIYEDTPTIPISPYGVSKLTTDRYAAVYARMYGLPTAALRPFAVYGPRLRKQVVYDFIRKLSEGSGVLNAHGDGTQVRDFCYVTDVVEAALTVEQRAPLQGEVYNVASGDGCSIRNLLELLCEQLGVRPTVAWSGAVRPGEPERWIPDIGRLKSLGWSPSISLSDGLRRTVAWFRDKASRHNDKC